MNFKKTYPFSSLNIARFKESFRMGSAVSSQSGMERTKMPNKL
jgi:hypothetical protein